MANYYWVGGTGTWNATNSTSWASSSGGTGGAGIPTATDNAYLDANSGTGTVTFATGSVCTCNNLTCTGYTGTLAYSGSTATTVTIAGSLTFSTGMTFTVGSGAGQIFNFTSTTTGNTITTGTLKVGSMTFNGVGGGWTLASALNGQTTGSASVITLTAGALSTGTYTLSNIGFSTSGTSTRSLDMSSTTWTITSGTWSVSSAINFTLTGTTSSNLYLEPTTNVGYYFGGITYNGTVEIVPTSSSATTVTIEDTGNTFYLFAIYGNAGPVSLSWPNLLTVTYELVFGYYANYPIYITSAVIGTPSSLAFNGSSYGFTNATFMDISASGSFSWNLSSGTTAGDAGGNSGITFPAGINIYWYKDTGTIGSTTGVYFLATNGGGGAARMPLPQDTLIFDANSFSATGKTITASLTTLAGGYLPTLDFSATTKTFTFSTSSVRYLGGLVQSSNCTLSLGGYSYFYTAHNSTVTSAGKTLLAGSTASIIAPRSGVTLTFSDAYTSTDTGLIQFAGAGNTTFNNTFTSGGNISLTSTGTLTFTGNASITGVVTISGAGTLEANGTLTASSYISCIAGTLSVSSTVSASYLTLSGGTFTASSGNVSVGYVTMSSGTLNMGSGTWTVSNTGSVWTCTSGTLNCNTSTINITDATTTAKTFAGGGKTYYNFTATGDNIKITGSNTFSGTFAVNNAGLPTGLLITSATTQTLSASSNAFTNNGSSGSLNIIHSITSGTAFIFSVPNESISTNYLSLKDCHVSGGHSYFAGLNSINTSNNTGWAFSIFNAKNQSVFMMF